MSKEAPRTEAPACTAADYADLQQDSRRLDKLIAEGRIVKQYVTTFTAQQFRDRAAIDAVYFAGEQPEAPEIFKGTKAQLAGLTVNELRALAQGGTTQLIAAFGSDSENAPITPTIKSNYEYTISSKASCVRPESAGSEKTSSRQSPYWNVA